MKKALVFITVFCLMMTMFADTLAAASYSTAKPPLSIQILGKKVTPAPILYKDKVMVPLRAVGQALGYQVVYSEKIKTMDLMSKGSNITVTIGYSYARVNGSSVKMETAPVLSNESLYVPLSFVEANFKYDVKFDSNNNMVIISKPGASSTPVSTPPAASQPSVTKPAVSNAIMVLGKKVNNQEKALAKSNVVYIPLRLVGEGLGYKVTWNSRTSTMTLEKSASKVDVAAGKTTATVNKQTIKLDGAPYLYGGRLYAPLSMINKTFGYIVAYDQKSNSVAITRPEASSAPAERPDLINIVNIAYDDNGGFSQINITADRPIASFNSFTMTNTDRLVIDMSKTVLNLKNNTLEIGNDGLDRVRTGKLNAEAVRIVVDMQSQRAYKLVQSEDKKTISIVYANIISPVTYSKEGEFDVVTVKGSTALESTDMKLDNPDRIVLDINRAVFNNLLQEISASSELLKGIRIGQYDTGTARIVLDVQSGVYYEVKTQGNTAKIYLSSYPFEFVGYNTYYNTGIINLNPGIETSYNVSIDQGSNSVNVEIPQDLKLESERIQINDNLIQYIDIGSQYKNGSKVTTASIKMQDSIESEVVSAENTKLIKIRFKRKITSLNQLTIVVDAGHGGKDPGAIAADGTTEKDLNLDVAFRLEKYLKILGFNTIMTRRDDTFVELGRRADIANQNYADFFISIHFNAFNQSTKGIETLYYPNTTNEDYTISNRQIAEIFHNEVIGTLNMPSRGITARPNLYVLNKTKMPAILAELGFLTNPQELALIKTEVYREKSARALAVSIVKYFRDIQGVSIDIDLNSIYSWPYEETAVQTEAVEESEIDSQDSEQGIAEQAPVQEAAIQPQN